MATAFKCDRCHATYADNNHIYKKGIFLMVEDDPQNYVEDLCPECYTQLIKWLENKNATVESSSVLDLYNDDYSRH